MSTMLQIHNLNKSFGPDVIFDDLSLTISEKQKIGVIGRNGAGKSTLFKIIVGDEEKNSGDVVIHNDTRIGYLTQHDPFDTDEVVMKFLQRMSDKETWECAKMASEFHIPNDQLEHTIGSFAGGYQMRIKLIALLLQDPNLLLLDEPTNYLDLSTLLLLEKFLQNYQGTFLVISHDREFLKNTCEETLDIEHGKAFLFPRPLEEYLKYKEEQLELKLKENKKIEKQKEHLQAFVDRFRYKASKASQAQSKLKQIAKLKHIEILHPLSTARIRIPDVKEKHGCALSINDVSIGYPEKIVATHISFDVDRGEHIAIVGDNGQGKTTFLKTIAGSLPNIAGEFHWGTDISLGYYAQHVPQMLDNKDKVGLYLERMAGPGITQEDVFKMAGNFLFPQDDLNKSVSILSGGEKARLCLAGLLLQKNDVLLLDEPTNHLDFETVEALAHALNTCNRTVLFISHNRTFVNLVASSIVEVNNGKVTRYHHDYENYVYHLDKKMHHLENDKKTHTTHTLQETHQHTDQDKQERKILYEQVKKAKKELQATEHALMELEKEKQSLLSWFENNLGEYSQEKSEQLHEVTYFLQEKEAEWVEIQEKVEMLEKKLKR